jgi:hypothetical protein
VEPRFRDGGFGARSVWGRQDYDPARGLARFYTYVKRYIGDCGELRNEGLLTVVQLAWDRALGLGRCPEA